MSLTIETPIHFKRARAGRKKLAAGKPEPKKPEPPDPIPRISRLMALAIHFDGLIRKGIVRDYADLARLGGVSRARITQIMNLLSLAQDIQEEILFLPKTTRGRDPVSAREVLKLGAIEDWEELRERWRRAFRSQILHA